MKKTLLWLVIAAVFASCSPGKGNGEEEGDGSSGNADSTINALIDSAAIPLHIGKEWVDRYHAAIGLNEEDSFQVISFMLDANVLRAYLNSDTTLSKLDVYLAHNDTGRLSVVYIGAALAEGSETEYIEKPYFKNNGDAQPYVFDHGVPCPKCDKEGLFSANSPYH